jgi:thioredoxin reductase/bacterioferritin-associated ferredoxin
MPTIAIVGAGPAGLAASVAAVDGGCSVVLIDEAGVPGGQIYRQAQPPLKVPSVGTPQEIERKRALLAEFERVRSKVDYRPHTTAHSLYPGPELQIAEDTFSQRLKPDAVILATGVTERSIPLPGWTLPGVFYAGGAQALLKAQGVLPGKRIVVAGVGALPLAVGAQLSKAGVHVAAVALLHPLSNMAWDPIGLWAGRRIVREGLQYKRWLKDANVPVLEGWAPVSIEGVQRANAVVLAPVDGEGRHILSQSRRFEVDAVALNFGFTANSELARMAGAVSTYDPIQGGWLPTRNTQGQTSVAHVYVAGDGAGLRGALVAAAEGRIVGAAAACALTGQPMLNISEAEQVRKDNERFQAALRRTLPLPKGVWEWAKPDTVVCRCECVTRGRIETAVSEGHCSLDGLKRNTRVGMGWCGGRTCLQAAAAYVHGGVVDASLESMRPRPVARPVKFGALANERPL